MQDPWLPLDSRQCLPPITHQGLFERVRQFQSPTKIRVWPLSHTSCPAQRRMKQGLGSCSKVMPSLEHLKEDGRLSHTPGDCLLSPADPALRRNHTFSLHVSEAPRKTQHCLPRFIYLGDLCGICLPVCLWDAQCWNKSRLGPGEYFRTIPSMMTVWSGFIIFNLAKQPSRDRVARLTSGSTNVPPTGTRKICLL